MNNEAMLFAYVSEQLNFFHTRLKFDLVTQRKSLYESSTPIVDQSSGYALQINTSTNSYIRQR